MTLPSLEAVMKLRVPPYIRRQPGGPTELVTQGGRVVEPLTVEAAHKLLQELATAIGEEMAERRRADIAAMSDVEGNYPR